MKNYFEMKLSARKVVWPILGLLLLYFVASVFSSFLVLGAEPTMEGTEVLSVDFWKTALLWFVILVGGMVAAYALLLPITKATLEAFGTKEAQLETDYSWGIYMRKVVVGSLLSVITLGIYTPWMLVDLTRYLFGNTYYRLRPLGFHGKAMELFAIVTLVTFLPVVVVFPLLTYAFMTLTSDVAGVLLAVLAFIVVLVWMGLFCVLITRWMINLSVGDERLLTDMPTGEATMFIVGQMLLTLLTLGLYTPMMELRLMQYFAEHTRVGEGPESRRLGMTLRAWRDWAYVWGQALLVMITFGIYLPWYYTKIVNRFVSRIYEVAN